MATGGSFLVTERLLLRALDNTRYRCCYVGRGAHETAMAEDRKPSRKPGGEWFNLNLATLAYTFVLGAIVGAIFAVTWGSVAGDGRFLTVYLSVLGAMFAAALGWFGTRAADSLVDRRLRRRKANLALMRIRHLAYQLFELERLLRPFLDDPTRALPENFMGAFAARTTSVGLAAATIPDFDALIEDDKDIYQVISVTNTFLTLQATFPAKLHPPTDNEVSTLLQNLIHPKGIDGCRIQYKALQTANTYFTQHQSL